MIAPGYVTVPDPKYGAFVATVPTFRNPTMGQWSLTWLDGQGWQTDGLNFGGINCRSIPADYDGDGVSYTSSNAGLDRATFCGDTGEWRIAYSSKKFPVSADGLRHVNLPPIQDALPAFIYPGGTSYQDIQTIYDAVNYLCPTVAPNGNNPPCSLWTMQPVPIGPYFSQCADTVKKSYAGNPCLDPNKKVACETMHIQQAQCVWQ